MNKRLIGLLVPLLLVIGIFSLPSLIPLVHAPPGTVCLIQPNEVPTATGCPALAETFNGPNTDATIGPTPPGGVLLPTQIRVAVFIAASDPLNGFEITLFTNDVTGSIFLKPAGIDMTGSVIPSPFTILAECLDGHLIAGSVCAKTDTLGTLHLAIVGPGGFISIPPTSGLLFTAIYDIVGTTPAPSFIRYQTGCAGTSTPDTTTCVTISNGTTSKPTENILAANFNNPASSVPYVTLDSANVADIGQVFAGTTGHNVALDLSGQNGWGAQPAGAAVTLSFSTTGPGITGSFSCALPGCPTNPDLALTTDNTASAVTLSITIAATTAPGTYTASAIVSYTVIDPLTGFTNTLSEPATVSLTVVDFNISPVNSATVPFWCPAATQGAACPAGQSGSFTISVSSNGYTGAVALSNLAPTPATVPPLSVTYSLTSIPGATGSSIVTFSGGQLRPTVGTVMSGSYSVLVRATGTLPTGTKVRSITFTVRPQDFSVTPVTTSPCGATNTVSFISGSSASCSITLNSLPSGTALINTAGFAGPITLSSTIVTAVPPGTGLTVGFVPQPAILTGGGSVTDTISFGGTVSTTTIFTVSITGTGTLGTSTPSTQTHSATYTVTITALVTTHPTSTTVACTPSTIDTTMTSSCTATVTDTAIGATTPTGTVALSSTGATGTFTTCTLAPSTPAGTATCTSTFTPTSTGTASIVGIYSGDTGHTTSTSPATTVLVTAAKHSTTTTVSCTPTAVAPTQVVSCTATVADTSATPTNPTGTITWTQTGTGTFSVGTCTLSGGTPSTCSVTYTPTATGAHDISASYGGDPTHAISNTAAPTTITVTQDSTTTTVVCTPLATAPNQATQCTVTVTDTVLGRVPVNPTGTVTWSHTGTGTFSVGTCTLNGGTPSTCSVTYTPTATGSHDISASYGGDAVHAISSSTIPSNIVVTLDPTTTTINCTPTAVAPTQVVNCTATVTDTITGRTPINPTGTVSWTHTGTGTFNVGTCTLNGGTPSTCSVTYTPSAIGSHDITATYVPDPQHSVSTSTPPTTITVTLDPTTTTVICSSTAVAPTQTVTCTATVTDTVTGRTPVNPTGTVTWTHTGTGTFSVLTCTLNGGTPSTCGVSYTPGATGLHDISASYGGSAIHAGSNTVTAVRITVTLDPTTTTVLCTPAGPALNQQVTCTATVADTVTGRSPVNPTGTVTWTHTGTGTFSVGSCTLNGGTPSTCSVNYTPTATGSHQVTGSYGGSAIHDISSNSFTVTVGANPTSTAISCIPSTVAVGQATSCTATVTDTSTTGATAPTGTVTFTPGGPCTLTTPTVTSASCSVAITPSAAGSLSVSAVYSPDATHSSSSGSATVTVNKRTTTIVVACIPTTIAVGQTTSCTATVTDSSTAGTAVTPIGTITFTPAAIGTCTLAGTGATATCSASEASTPFPGTLMVTATFAGDASHTGSGPSTAFPVTVNPRTTSTSVSCPSTGTVGAAFTCTVTVTDTDTGTANTPTGTFTVNGQTCTLASGTCTISITPTATGSLTVTANYPGDTTHAASTGIATVNISQPTAHSTTTTVSCTPSKIAVSSFGTTTYCTATVTDTSTTGATAPSGTVAFTETGIATGTLFQTSPCTLGTPTPASASCSVYFSSANPGVASISATYTPSAADTTHSGSSSATPATVTVTPTFMQLQCFPSVIAVAQSQTCAIAVNGFPTAPTGTVTFTVTVATGTFTPPTCTLVQFTISGGLCAVTFSATTVGAATITAHYNGDSNYPPDSISVQVTVANLHPTSISLVCTPTTVTTSELVTCTATVTDTSTSAPTTPTGTIILPIFNNANAPVECTLAGTTATATCTGTGTATRFAPTPPFTLGGATWYDGDTAHDGSTTTFAFNIVRTTTTTISCPATGTVGTAFTCTVTVTDNDVGTTSTPTGTVTVNSVTCTLAGTAASATCTVSITPTAPGSLTVTANYPGDTAHATSTGSATVNVSQSTAHSTSTIITCNPTSVVVGQASTCTATVTDTSTIGATTPTGIVTFTPGGPCTLQTATRPSATCSVTVTPINLAVTPLPVTASYGGDTSHSGSTSNTVNLTVTARSTTTSITCVPLPVNTGSQAACTVSVTDTDVGGFIPPLGQVTVSSNGAGSFIGSPCTLVGTTAVTTCHVTYTPTGTAPRTDTLTANYSPATTHLTSSGTFQLSVTQQVVTPGHAKLIQWRADAKFNPDNLRRNPTQILRAYGQNDGDVTVSVYVRFDITNPDGTTRTIYTMVVQLASGQSINGRLDNRFTASFNPLPGRTSITATIFYSSSSSTVGDASFKPDTASAKTFSFRAPGTRIDDFNFNDDVTTTCQLPVHASTCPSFDASIHNQANIDLLSRLDITIHQPDDTTFVWLISTSGLLLHSGQDVDQTVVVPLTGPDGDYCFTVTLKFGIDANHSGVLDNNEILGTGGTQHDCFFIDTDDAPAKCPTLASTLNFNQLLQSIEEQIEE